MVINGYQWLYMVMDGYQWLYMVFNGYTWFSMVVHGDQCCTWLSVLIHGYQWLRTVMVINGYIHNIIHDAKEQIHSFASCILLYTME